MAPPTDVQHDEPPVPPGDLDWLTDFDAAEGDKHRGRVLGRSDRLFARYPWPTAIFVGSLVIAAVMLIASLLWPLQLGGRG
ncbi:hypothetical protein EYE40_00935 [Glaciihabitans arcticus]|uniref:Uncharacterized protein n=1 Tax=Glaciihabitans arcticus TaxID=2668039 RepID=A0A4Q9GQ36_9MICO|nr:hypothetical protein [Glaciihabitans arcticus]TBN56074.1 hypothetical protein EYE40_00935 [Glaciihabitans arcticus]